MFESWSFLTYPWLHFPNPLKWSQPTIQIPVFKLASQSYSIETYYQSKLDLNTSLTSEQVPSALLGPLSEAMSVS